MNAEDPSKVELICELRRFVDGKASCVELQARLNRFPWSHVKPLTAKEESCLSAFRQRLDLFDLNASEPVSLADRWRRSSLATQGESAYSTGQIQEEAKFLLRLLTGQTTWLERIGHWWNPFR